MRGRAWGLWALGVALVATAARTVVALPERCPPVDAIRARAAAEEAVGWFARNQRADGSFLYRYDRTTGRDLGGYLWVRHAGVLLALEQAAGAGIPLAAATADGARSAALARLDRRPGWAALPDVDRTYPMGGTALLTVALGERRLRTGRTDDDGVLRDLGAALVAQVQPDGSVLDRWDPATGAPVPGRFSPFTSGEVAFALARLDRLFPGEGWGAPAGTILGHLATRRAAEQGYVPDASDHWAAYAMAELVHAGGVLDPTARSWARRQFGIMAIQTRYESQRTDGGLDRWLRGRRTLGAGLGTIGEALARWREVAAADPVLGRWAAGLDDRLACVASMAADRQHRAGGPAERGAWFQFGITQMDDQQHALSALLGEIARQDVPAPTGEGRRPGVPVPEQAALAALAAAVALDLRRTTAAGRHPGRLRLLAVPAVAALTALLAILGGPLTRAIGVSAPTAVVAAGAVLAATGLVRLLTGDRPGGRTMTGAELPATLAPPALVLVALALGAGGQGPATVIGAAVVAAVGVALAGAPDPIVVWAARMAGGFAVLAGVGLVVAGVFAV